MSRIEIAIRRISWKALCLTVIALSFACPANGRDAKVKSGIAEVNGTKLYYEMMGKGSTIVLIHGGLVDSRMWDDQF